MLETHLVVGAIRGLYLVIRMAAVAPLPSGRDNYFPKASRDKMLRQLWAFKQGSRTVAEYEAEFNRLMKFAPAGIT